MPYVCSACGGAYHYQTTCTQCSVNCDYQEKAHFTEPINENDIMEWNQRVRYENYDAFVHPIDPRRRPQHPFDNEYDPKEAYDHPRMGDYRNRRRK
jgi:hypothetical protein